MSIKKMSFLPKMRSRSGAKTTDEAVESEEAQQNDASVPQDQEIDMPHPPVIIDANDVDAALNDKGEVKFTEAATSSPKKSPRKFLSSTLNKFSPGRSKSKASEEPAMFDVACENGANNGQENFDDEDMSVEVNMAAAMKGLGVKEDEDDNEQGRSNEDAIAEEKEATAKMTALEKLRKGSDDDDIDLKELAREIKGKLKSMVNKKSVKSESTPNNVNASDDKPVSDEENKVVTHDAEITADDKPAGEEKEQAEESKANPAETAVKAPFLTKLFKSKSVKPESTPNNENTSDDKPVSDEENKVVTQNAENASDDKPEGEEKEKAEESKANPAETAVKAPFLTKLFKSKSVKPESTPNNENTSDDKPVSDEENKVVTQNAENASDDKPAGEEKEKAEESKVNPAETAVKTSFLSKLFKSDDKSDKTAPSVPSEEEQPTNEEAVAVAASTENKSENTVPCDVADASPGKRFKFTKLLSKRNDVSSVDATRSEPGTKAAEGTSSSEDVQDDDKKAIESEPNHVAEGIDDAKKNTELQKGKSVKSKFMKKLGIAGAAGVAGVAAVKASDTDEDKTTTLEVVVHADKPVSEVPLDEVPIVAEADKAGSDTNNKEITELDVQEQIDEQDETTAESTGNDGATEGLSTDDPTEEVSLQDERSSAEQSRCGLGDHIHDVLMHAGQVVYETCGDPDYGTACKMLCVMEAAENACGGSSNEVEKEEAL